MANPLFGAQISEAGTGYTWAGNSQLHQLTSWSNDPLTDSSSEAFFVQDLRTREVWSLGAGSGSADATYAVAHDQGSTTIAHRRGEVDISATWCVDTAQSIKHVRVELHNVGSRSQRFRLVGIFEWVMGTRQSDRGSVRTAFASLTSTRNRSTRIDALLATQRDSDAGFGGSTAFVAARIEDTPDATLDDWTCDRRELFDGAGRRVIPDRLGKQAGVGSRSVRSGRRHRDARAWPNARMRVFARPRRYARSGVRVGCDSPSRTRHRDANRQRGSIGMRCWAR